MLQFWKKSGHNDKNCYQSASSKALKVGNCSNSSSFDSVKSCPLQSFDDEGLFDIDEFESTKERSKLSKTLQEVLSDKAALGYFVQYMESRNAARYILCWLDIDSFKSDIFQCKERKTPNISPMPNFKGDHDSLSVSTDCDSYDTNSLYDFSTATISDSRVTQSSLEVNGFCDRDLSDTSPKMKSLTETLSVDDRKGGQIFVENALMIFKKYIAQEATHNVKCSEAARNEIIESVCDIDKVLVGNCFNKVQNYVYEIMEKEYFDAFLGSDYFCKHQIDVLTSGNVALDDLLYNETALFYFMEFLEQENSRSLLEFWIAATNLQQQLHDQKEFFDPIEAQNDAVVLYDKYFSLQAHCPLGFSDRIRFEVEQNICGENGLVLDCFNLPLKIVEQVLERNYLKTFLASQLFYKYLSELINTVQSNGYSMNIENNKPSPSDCSSERSFSTNSTFLALEINHNSAKKSRDKCTDMSIDTKQLCDPDSLWKRKRNHRLSCGRVTALGKFETDLEPEPDKNGFKLKNVVKKFVSLDEDKKREEMAWQVAEMIVKDITSVTLNQEKPRNS
ncbi:RGS domain containing protein [Asbolus verrucosus]|uniref:RGS domain containing protein n=1 Tax=Asbolus verrucosus TaxID=1661398 RepID=A0A482WBF5_ASBVE|nr:RGS domain containing protein [Asbolus verrucosus]